MMTMTYAAIVCDLLDLINTPNPFAYPDVMRDVARALDAGGHTDAAWHVVMGRHQQALNNLALEMANNADTPGPAMLDHVPTN
jgi:hypothetical protein